MSAQRFAKSLAFNADVFRKSMILTNCCKHKVVEKVTYAYANDLALLHSCRDWKGLEETFKPKHGYTLSVSQDLEAETQPC